MIFEVAHIYHIYNQGNNKQKIFFRRENYLYFLNKIHEYIIPYGDVLAWCLMPNHFHLMVYVHTLEVPTHNNEGNNSEAFTSCDCGNSEAFTSSESFTGNEKYLFTIVSWFGFLL